MNKTTKIYICQLRAPKESVTEKWVCEQYHNEACGIMSAKVLDAQRKFYISILQT